MKNKSLILISLFLILFVGAISVEAQSKTKDKPILIDFQEKGIWKVDRANHRCLVDPGVWELLPFEQKEQVLKVIYVEEKTWWELYDYYSGKLLGKVSSWGWKVYP
jgi:hypothetical protein